jgi:hypothetical protein
MKTGQIPFADPSLSSKKATIIFLIVGIAMIVGAVIFNHFMNPVNRGFARVEATISSIDNINESAFVSFVYQGTSYTDVSLNSYSSTWFKGMSISIYVNPSDPTQAMTVAATNIFVYFFIGIGSIMTISALVVLIKEIVNIRPFFPAKNDKNRKRGRLMSAKQVTGGRFVMTFSVEGKDCQSQSCRGRCVIIQKILEAKEVNCDVFLDEKGRFNPDYPKLNEQLATLSKDVPISVNSSSSNPNLTDHF